MTRWRPLRKILCPALLALPLLLGCGSPTSSSKDGKAAPTGEQPKKDSDTKPTGTKHEPG